MLLSFYLSGRLETRIFSLLSLNHCFLQCKLASFSTEYIAVIAVQYLTFVGRKGQLIIVQTVILVPLGIKLCLVFGLGFPSHGLFPVFSEHGHCKMLSILWNFWASVGKEMARAPLSWWLEGRINKVSRGPCSRQDGQLKTEQEKELRSAYTALKASLFKGCVCPKDRGRILFKPGKCAN